MSAVCNLCPRQCNIDRSINRGYCRTSDTLMVARAALHMWEEPCISGEAGSGAIFFSGCNMQCVFCQNREIATGKVGKEISVQRLSEIMLELKQKGANNINLVTPSHYVEAIVEAIAEARSRGLDIPIVYNSSAYEKVDTLKKLEGYVDVYLPDFKYCDDELAIRYSGAADYKVTAIRAIGEMLRQVGVCEYNDNGLIGKGVIIRHLILPGHTADSKAVLRAIKDNFGTEVPVSLMSQYTPLEHVSDYPEINRRITAREYDKVVDYALELGLDKGFIQDMDVAEESFIPDFNCEGV